jgi:hypothetical protein
MPASVSLKEILDAFEMQSEESQAFVDRERSEVHVVSNRVLGMVEECEPPDELPDWQQHEYQLARSIVKTDRFLRLPSKFDIHEWEIMDRFSRSVTPEHLAEEFGSAIRGRGAFRMFKDALRRHKLWDAWNEFRDRALREIAIDWCEESGLAYRDD